MTMIRISMIFTVSMLLLSACDNSSENENATNSESENVLSGESVSLEDKVAEIDAMQDSLASGSSLYYTKEGGTSVSVDIFLNDSSEIVKLIEKYTVPEFSSILTKIFYLDKGKKIVTKEFFEEKTVNGSQFVERVSYYDANEKPILTRRRTAPFEELLEQEAFINATPFDCSMKRALDVINQQGEFVTTFQGFIQNQGTLYLIVGEDTPSGYVSSLLVQSYTPTITKLMNNERKMIGTPLTIHFETANSSEHFEYQRLLAVQLKEK